MIPRFNNRSNPIYTKINHNDTTLNLFNREPIFLHILQNVKELGLLSRYSSVINLWICLTSITKNTTFRDSARMMQQWCETLGILQQIRMKIKIYWVYTILKIMNQLLKCKAMKATHTIQGVSSFCALIWKHKNYGISF